MFITRNSYEVAKIQTRNKMADKKHKFYFYFVANAQWSYSENLLTSSDYCTSLNRKRSGFMIHEVNDNINPPTDSHHGTCQMSTSVT